MMRGLVQASLAIVGFALGWILRSASTDSATGGGATSADLERMTKTVDERLVAIEHRLDSIASSTSIPPDPKPKDVAAVDSAYHEFESDPRKGSRLEFGATRADLVRKFGSPDETTRSGPTIEWVYYPSQGESGIQFEIEDGMVQSTKTSSPTPDRVSK